MILESSSACDDHQDRGPQQSRQRPERAGCSWAQTAKLLPAIPYPYDDFGDKVAIDGSFILIGDPTDDDEAVGAGAAHVFERVGGVWTEQDEISSPLSGSYDYFGEALAWSDTSSRFPPFSRQW